MRYKFSSDLKLQHPQPNKVKRAAECVSDCLFMSLLVSSVLFCAEPDVTCNHLLLSLSLVHLVNTRICCGEREHIQSRVFAAQVNQRLLVLL